MRKSVDQALYVAFELELSPLDLELLPSQPAIPQRNDPDAYMAAEPTLSSLAMLASETQGGVDQDPTSSADSSQKTKEQIRRHYVRTLHKVIDESDIVILVLDARDPEGCRSRLVEEEVRRRENEGKKLIFVLNKIGVHVGFIWYSTVFLIVRHGAKIWCQKRMHSSGSDTCDIPHQLSHSVLLPLINVLISALRLRPGFCVSLKHLSPVLRVSQLVSSASQMSVKAVSSIL
jgi:hypothetical protein